MKNSIKVKLVSRGTKEVDILGFSRQTPGNKGKLDSCIFNFNSLEKDYDWLVIIDDVPKYIPNRIEKAMGITVFRTINKTSLNQGKYENLKKDAIDLYPFLRDIYTQNREKLIKE